MEDFETTEEEAPSYILPLFFTSKTQEIFQCKADEEVTEENPYKIITKEEIQQDFRDRAAISDFHPVRKIVEKYPADDLLVVYDPLFKYGQNFYLITDDEQKQLILQPPAASESVADLDEKLGDGTIPEIRIGLRTPQPWVSFGSEQEVMEEMVRNKREKLKLTFERVRLKFGAPVQFHDYNDGDVIECMSYEDETWSVTRKEIDASVQHVYEAKDATTQTKWACPRNAGIQYESRHQTEHENNAIMRSNEIVDFIEEVIPRFELALKENATLDLFTNDYLMLGEEDNQFATKSANHLKEYQSFTDLKFSKNKMISDIQWHPAIKGIIAVACIQHATFYDRIDNSSKSLMTPSLILIWSFTDPIHPLMLLEAPDDILCFSFNPTDPNIIVGGCINGQLVLWDISSHDHLLLSHQSLGQGVQHNANSNLPIFLCSNAPEQSPMIKSSAVSSIENSHRMAVTDLQWVPDHIEIAKRGVVHENKSGLCTQIMTSSIDGTVLFWDTKLSKLSDLPPPTTASEKTTTFLHLDLTWKPLLKVNVRQFHGTASYSPMKFVISEIQGPLKKKDTEHEVAEDTEFDSYNNAFHKVEEAKVLTDVDTTFHVATETGFLVCLDWQPTKDKDSGKYATGPPKYCLEAHDAKINSLLRSPFLNDIFLTVGGWTFAIWKKGVTFGPLFRSYAHDCMLTTAHWSPTRAGVFFIGRADGNVDVWDILDKSHEPFLSQNVSPVPIMCVFPNIISDKQQLLAIGDEVGTLHIMEVPWNLRHATNNEFAVVDAYLEREATRLDMRNSRVPEKPFVDENVEEIVQEQISDKEWEMEAKQQYSEYLDFEERILLDLGEQME